MSTYEEQGIPRAEMHDDGTLTIAVTFRWRKPWAMDRCEVVPVVGHLRDAIVEKLADYEQLAALESVLCWDPNEETLIGRWSEASHRSNLYNRPILFPAGEREPTARDLELDQAWRDLIACVDNATYAAHCGDFGSLPMMADAARGIIDALSTIHPHPQHEGDSVEWTAIDRHCTLNDAIRRAHRSQVWTADTLNSACTSALRITKGWDHTRQEFAS